MSLLSDFYSDPFGIGTLVSVAAVGVILAATVAGAVLVHPVTLALGGVTGLSILLVRIRQNRQDVLSRERAREVYLERQEAAERAAMLSEVDRYFPFIREPFEESILAGAEPEDAFWQSVVDAPAVELGTTIYNLPGLLPFSERPKHLYVVGKTGSGKTSLLLNLIREDLEAGRGVAVIAPEAELFRDWLLPIIPRERTEEVVYFAPGRRDNPLTFNPLSVEPGDDPRRAAGELFTVFKRAFGDDDLGTRVAPILANALSCLVGRNGSTLLDVKRMLVDASFREQVVGAVKDPYARDFWFGTYPNYPKGAYLPILNRLDQFLRPPAIRQAFCHPQSSFSIRRVLDRQAILLIDLSHLDPESMMLLGQLTLATFQLELMRREKTPEDTRPPFHLYADEFQSFAGVAEGSWRELLSRGRRYGLALTLAHQHPSQLSRELQAEILGNVASIVAFGLSAKDAYAVRREFVEEDPKDFKPQPIAQEVLTGLKVGQAVARLGGGAFALPLKTRMPQGRPSQAVGQAVRAHSWHVHGIPLASRPQPLFAGPEKTPARDRKTRAAAPLCAGDGIQLGVNTHGDKSVDVALTDKQRTQHMYVIGSSGTGKSTFLLNCIVQGMERGEGLAILDPHGDLIEQILALVPKGREKDVVLVDPADREWPVGFNILQAHSDLEKELLASDLVAVFRRLSSRWGDQMNSVLANAILAFLESERGGTLLDMRRFLVEADFRKEFLGTIRDEDVIYYWEKEFPLLPGKPQAPLLTRLDTFLRPKLIRNMVAQRKTELDFGRIMDSGGIFLGKLSQGAIGESNAYLLGSLMVSKFYQLAITRQAVEQKDRRPFYLYVDECHNFLTPSMASILAGARKYHLGLILAHQDLQQVKGRDSDVLSAVITNPYTRVCFRVGDLDAKALEKGFAHFDAKDLQSLGVGEAICRVERADYDFNLKTRPMPSVDPKQARKRQQRLVTLSRERYARPRTEVEARRHAPPSPVQDAPPAPIAAPSPAATAHVVNFPTAAKPETPPPAPVPIAGPTPGRGGKRHKYLQSLIKRWGESHGYRATVERPILKGAASVDVALEGRERSIAIEISVTTSPKQEMKHIRDCLKAGFDHLIAVSESPKTRDRLEKLLDEELGETERAKVQCLGPDSLFKFLGKLNADNAKQEQSVRGYKVRVQYAATDEPEARHKQRAISDVVASALRRMKE